MSLAQCVKDILCGLSMGVRNALSAIIQQYVTQIDLLTAEYEAKLIYLDILSAPPQILNGLVQDFISEVKSGASLVPLDLIGNCVDFGDLSLAIQENLDAVLIDANVIANDLSRMLSFKDELQANLDDLRAVRDLYIEVLAQIDICNELGLTP